jgi:membrane associated rhomboid family serine protease
MIHKIYSYLLPIVFILLVTFFHILSFYTSHSLANFGVYPMQTSTFLNIFTAPFIHISSLHFFSNVSSLIVLLYILFTVFKKVANIVFVCGFIIPGIFTWFIGRPSLHIGASGLVYTLITFMLVIGFLSKKREVLAISFIMLALYGGFVWGVLPIEKGISWEYHLGGGITGICLAYFFKDFNFNPITIAQTNIPTNQSSTADGVEYIYENKL